MQPMTEEVDGKLALKNTLLVNIILVTNNKSRRNGKNKRKFWKNNLKKF